VNTRMGVLVAMGLVGMLGCKPKTEAGGGMAKSNMAADSAATAQAAKVEITEPAEGATVTSPVKIVLKTTGVEIVAATDERPGTGHHHLFVDKDVTPAGDTMPRGVTGILHLGRGQTEIVDTLKPGPHRIIAVVGDFKHIALSPMVSDTVNFTVKAGGKAAAKPARRSTTTKKR
jgi:hypothetical protein